MSNTTTIPKIAPGQIEDLPISKIINLQTELDNIVPPVDEYVHPTQSVIDTSLLSGPSVISRIQVNGLGHVSAVSTRDITPASIGAQIAGNYETLSNKSASVSLGNSNALYPTQNAVKSYVDASVNNSASKSITISAGDGLSGGGNLSTSRSLSVDSSVLRTNSTNQTKFGLLTISRGISGNEVSHMAFDYPDNNGEDYHLRLYNKSENNNVRYYFKQKIVLGLNDVRLDLPVLGFKNAITVIGADSYPETGLEIEDYYNVQTNPATRHPLRLYVAGDAVFSGGIKTKQPGTQNLSVVNWKLGEDNPIYGVETITHVVEVELDGTVFELYGRIKP